MSPSGWHRHLLRYAGSYRRSLLFGVLVSVAQALVLVAIPWPTKLAIDDVLRRERLPGWSAWLESLPGTDSSIGLLVALAAATVVLTVLHAVLEVVRRGWRRSLGLRITNDLARDTLELVQRRSLAARQSMRSGDLVQRVASDTRCVDRLVFGVWFTAFQSLLTFALLGGVMLTMSWTLAAVAAAAALPMLAVARVYRSRLEQQALLLADSQAAVTTAAEQMLSTLPEIQSFAAEDAERARFESAAQRQYRASVGAQRVASAFEVSIGSVSALGTGAVIAIGGLRAVDGSLTVGELLVFISYLGSIYAPVEGLAYLTHALATARAGAARILPLWAPDGELPEPEHPIRLPRRTLGAHVKFEGVYFDYDGRPVLSDVDFDVRPGEMVGIVGRTGSGKSTLVSLVPRFFDPRRGTVSIDGRDVRRVALRDVRRHVAFVHQDPLLLPLSVSDNIAYGSPLVDAGRVRESAASALAAEFIEELPEGYDTVLGERGATLSGGQRQRLAIARALYRPAPILILDEPTASLDAEAEDDLMGRLRDAAQGRTILLITHRTSTVRAVDRILVLDEGWIVEDGSHSELMEQHGRFAMYARAPFDIDRGP